MEFRRNTRETSVVLALDLDDSAIDLDFQCGFLAHMLELFAFHAKIGLVIDACGDVEVDYHHLAEDIGIMMGRSFASELEGRVIQRYGWCAMPMDGSLVLVAVDFSGRGQFEWDGGFPSPRCGDFDLELLPEFWRAVCREGRITLHARTLACDNSHHLAEALFKGAGRAFRQALFPADELQSTKGALV